MDDFSMPGRLEPVVPTENTRRQATSSDQRRRRNQEPRSKILDDVSDPLQDGEDSHNVDELA